MFVCHPGLALLQASLSSQPRSPTSRCLPRSPPSLPVLALSLSRSPSCPWTLSLSHTLPVSLSSHSSGPPPGLSQPFSVFLLTFFHPSVSQYPRTERERVHSGSSICLLVAEEYYESKQAPFSVSMQRPIALTLLNPALSKRSCGFKGPSDPCPRQSRATTPPL